MGDFPVWSGSTVESGIDSVRKHLRDLWAGSLFHAMGRSRISLAELVVALQRETFSTSQQRQSICTFCHKAKETNELRTCRAASQVHVLQAERFVSSYSGKASKTRSHLPASKEELTRED